MLQTGLEKSPAELPETFPMEIMYERFKKNHVYLKSKGIREVDGRRLLTYQVYKIISKEGFIFKEPHLLTMYVDPKNKKVLYFCKNERENKEILPLINPTVDSFGLEHSLGVESRKEFPDHGSFSVNGDKIVYFQRVGSATINNREYEGFAIIQAVDMEEEPYIMSDILTLYVNPETTAVEYFSQLCDPCDGNPQQILMDTEFSVNLENEIRNWRQAHKDGAS
jgi:hypothetical protein